MKTIYKYLIFSLILLAITACKSKNKNTEATKSIEDISIPDGSASEDIEIEEIIENKTIEVVKAEDNTTEKPVDTIEPKSNSTTTHPTKKSTQPSKTKDAVKEVKTKVIEKTSKSEVSKPVIVPTTKPVETTVDKVVNTNEDTNSQKTETKEKTDQIVTESNTTKPEKPEKVMVPVGYPNHKLFDSFLKRYVSNNGTVDYSSIKKNESELDAYLTTLENTKFNTTWSREDKLAFWINAYNAYTIELIINNYPVAKITDLHGGKPWDHKWIKLTGKTLSLNNIENDIIRPEFKEPRIHFAVNCAAKSCPPILNAAYTAGNLESKLTSQTKKFINNPTYNTLGKSEITISKIFEWYATDFGDVASYIARYADSTVKPTAEVKFNEYDWSLNGK